jgi:probable lipoprotein NlpC
MLSTVFYSCKSSRTSKAKSSHSRTASSRKSTYAKPSRPSVKAPASVDASAATETVIETARSFIGTPYKYGGTTRKGMDCSGLLFTSFKAVDINIPRTSQEQASMGKSVRTSDIQPGDLVFFTEKKGSNRISHVGLVTEVRDSDEIIFIHSTNSRGVMEDNLFSAYYHKIFVKAVRPF